MSGSRESTKQEKIVDSMYQSLRGLDKMTWYGHDKVSSQGNDLLEEAEYLRSQVNRYVDEIKYQMAKKP